MAAIADVISVFTRFPVPGFAKTRLIPSLGPEGAANLQRRMTEFVVSQAKATGARVEVRFTGGSVKQMRNWLGDDLEFSEQGSGDLGDRMARTFQHHFANGAKRVVIIGADCPENRSLNISNCLSSLKKHSCVIGPATDGGYYMIGLNKYQPELFQGISWGTEDVLRQTLAASRARVSLMPMLSDVDEIGDVAPKISVVIPALNEAQNIAAAIKSVSDGFDTECIVVDGGSSDDTVRLAMQLGASVIRSAPGRARQMNTGASHAKGDILLFLHADSELPSNWDSPVRRASLNPKIAMGAFNFRLKERQWGSTLLEWGVAVRSRCFALPYGDQGLFMTRERFENFGGFPEVPILEDVLLVRKAQNVGRIEIINEPLLTSGRRWERHGIIKTTLLNQLVLLAAAAGVDLDELRLAYRNGTNPLSGLPFRAFFRTDSWASRFF